MLVNLSKGRFETLHVIKPPHALIRAYHTTVRPLFEAILANTYHLMLRPGAERVAKFGKK